MYNLNYIGSKKSLFFNDSEFDLFLKKHINNFKYKKFIDLCSGTGYMSIYLSKFFKSGYCNDLQYYSYIISRTNTMKLNDDELNYVNNIIDKLNNIKETKKGFITRNYSPYKECKRMYFTVENAKLIDTIRKKIEKYKDNETIYIILLSSLISAADKIANVVSVYEAYLKNFKKSSLNKLKLEEFHNNVDIKIKSYNCDCIDLDINFDKKFIYIDPPYNNRKYSSNYHILDTIALYDKPNIKGITGMRENLHISNFNSKRNVYDFLTKILNKIKTEDNVVVLSYSSESLIPILELKELLCQYGNLYKKKIDYKKFQNNKKKRNVKEYLFIVK